MTFVQEDEVFPTLTAIESAVDEEFKESSVNEEAVGVNDAAAAKAGDKRKLPEKASEKKVFSLIKTKKKIFDSVAKL